MAITEKIFEISLLGTIFLLSFELSAGNSFYLVYIFLLGTVLSLGYLLFRNIKGEIVGLIQKINAMPITSKGIITLSLLYLSIDALNFLLSDYRDFAVGKYKVIILMLFISLAIYFYTKSEKSEFNIHLTLGLCSVFICVMSFFNYFVLRLYPIYYTLRLSLRSDYNMYSVAILTGLVCLFFCVKKQQINQYAFYFGGFPLCSACVILSGSRRGFLFWVVICIVFFVSDIVPQKGIQSCSLGKHIAVKIGIYAVFVCMTMLIVFFTEKGLYALYDEYGSFVNSQSGVVKIENETSYSQRLGTISKGSFMTKRLVIWKEAVEEIKSFDTKSILFGKGNGYDIYMYSESTNPRLWELYDKDTNKFNLSPHNFILSDILNGGISKAVVSFLLWVFICGELLKLLYYEKSLAFLYIIPLGMVFFGSIISGRYGFLYDKYFYIFITLVLFRHKQKFQTPIDNIKI